MNTPVIAFKTSQARTTISTSSNAPVAGYRKDTMTQPKVSSPTKKKERQPKAYEVITVPMIISSVTETFSKMLDKALQALEQNNPQSGKEMLTEIKQNLLNLVLPHF